jgi:hypothetical protein
MIRTALILSLVLGAIALTGCQSSQPEPDNQASADEYEPAAPAPEERRTRREAPAPVDDTPQVAVQPDRQLPQLDGELQSDGYGMTMIIDGSSPDAFANSLELIAADTSSRQYQDLNSALEYLQFKSMPPGGLPEFYRMFDGLTAEEVIEMANARSGR